MEIKAIETRWMGYRFRSRLEARWAVFFQHLGWRWAYEHQGYEIGWDDGDKMAWLPDFEIRTNAGQHLYVEVKGDPSFFRNGKFLRRFDFNGGPPGFEHSADNSINCNHPCWWEDRDSKPLVILGPLPHSDGTLFVPVAAHSNTVEVRWCEVLPDGFQGQPVEALYSKFFDDHPLGSYDLPDCSPKVARTPRVFQEVIAAMRAARAARFEHGESP